MKNLKISLSEEQIGWLNSRRETGGFASKSSVIRHLIREQQEQEKAQLWERFRLLEEDDSNEAESVDDILKIVKRVKSERRVG